MRNSSPRWNRIIQHVFLLGLFLSLLPISGAVAFNTRPVEQIAELANSGLSSRAVERFSDPVHEIITNRAWGCKNGNTLATKADDDDCSPGKAKSPNAAPPAIMAGAGWNDNPYFQLVN